MEFLVATALYLSRIGSFMKPSPGVIDDAETAGKVPKAMTILTDHVHRRVTIIDHLRRAANSVSV